MPFVKSLPGVLTGFGILVLLLELGNQAAHWLPLPGPLIGMILLFLLLSFYHGPASKLVIECGDHLLKYYAFFFVPAGVGVMVYASQLRANWFALVASLLVSSLLSLTATASVMGWMVRRSRRAVLIEAK